MKKTVAMIGILLNTVLAHAAAPIDGWYSSILGGYAWTPGNIDITRYGLTRNNSAFYSGFDAGGSLGYKSNPMRYEGEFTYIRSILNHFDLNGVRQNNVNGYTNAALGLANVYYDFPGIVATVQPFLGAGIGYAWIQDKFNSTGQLGMTSYTNANSVFAWQATGGLTYNFAENYALGLGYRYVATSNVPDLGEIFQAHLANVSAVYRFDGKRYT
jgi:opacity protein-like surface antigen